MFIDSRWRKEASRRFLPLIHQIGRKVMTPKLSHLSLLTRTTELTKKNYKKNHIYQHKGNLLVQANQLTLSYHIHINFKDTYGITDGWPSFIDIVLSYQYQKYWCDKANLPAHWHRHRQSLHRQTFIRQSLHRQTRSRQDKK